MLPRAMAIDNTDTPVIVWRHIFGKNVRDHGMARLDAVCARLTMSPLSSVSPLKNGSGSCRITVRALSISADVYHMAWFNHAPSAAACFMPVRQMRVRHLPPRQRRQ